MDINYVRPERQSKDYVPQKSVDDIPVTKALSGKAIRKMLVRGAPASLTCSAIMKDHK